MRTQSNLSQSLPGTGSQDDRAPQETSFTAAPADARPPLLRDRAFWGMTSAQFLGAFNDNLYKQLMLLLAIRVLPGNPGGAQLAKADDVQGLAMAVFCVPFLLFSGFAGFLSERISKRTIVVGAKVAEIGITLLGMGAFLSGAWYAMLGVLFLMGVHSAFFGPAKYGVLPEMFRERDLPQANGIFLMTTFLAIIFGTALAGFLKDSLGDRLWLASLACVMVAIAGTIAALQLRAVPPANAALRFSPGELTFPKEIRAILAKDRPLLLALLASCVFWFIGGVVQQAVNALGKVQFGLEDKFTSMLTACIGVGIAIGCISAGRLSGSRADFRLVRIGSWGIVGSLLGVYFAAALPGNGLRYVSVMVLLIGVGFCAGLFAVPLQVFLQSRPPPGLKGRTIASMNLANWIAIIGSAGVYGGLASLVNRFAWPQSTMFLATCAFMLPVALLYRPRNENEAH
jgi:acyl-[acyl-carrier-protein]-phospholipid O-acyltransferase/long-chain-fatty-acid--[acyl-carrier-protein] ligase